MSNQTDWRLLTRYLSGECSREELKKIHEWADSDPNNQELLEQTENIWNALEVKSHDWDVMAARLRLAQEAGLPASIKELQKETNRPLFSGTPKWPYRHRTFASQLFRIAAMLFFGVSVAYVIKTGLLKAPQRQQALEWNELIVKNENHAKITLNDGTKITLDAGSVLRYPEEFTGEKREVFLRGEGYFEVSPTDKQTAFLVYANDAVVNVLGTEFNVRAWPQTDRVKVTVVEGKVSFYSQKAGHEDAVTILPGELSVMPKNKLPSVPRQVDSKKQLAWLNYEMIFEDAPLSEVLHQLERWYNLKFRLTDNSLSSLLLTTHIKNEPVTDILESISLVMNLKYERSGNTVVFSPNDLNKNLKPTNH